MFTSGKQSCASDDRGSAAVMTLRSGRLVSGQKVNNGCSSHDEEAVNDDISIEELVKQELESKPECGYYGQLSVIGDIVPLSSIISQNPGGHSSGSGLPAKRTKQAGSGLSMTLRSSRLVSVASSDNIDAGGCSWYEECDVGRSFEAILREMKEECNFDYDEYDGQVSLDQNCSSHGVDIGDIVAMSSSDSQVSCLRTGEDSDTLGLQSSGNSCEFVAYEDTAATESVATESCVQPVSDGTRGDMDTLDLLSVWVSSGSDIAAKKNAASQDLSKLQLRSGRSINHGQRLNSTAKSRPYVDSVKTGSGRCNLTTLTSEINPAPETLASHIPDVKMMVERAATDVYSPADDLSVMSSQLVCNQSHVMCDSATTSDPIASLPVNGTAGHDLMLGDTCDERELPANCCVVEQLQTSDNTVVVPLPGHIIAVLSGPSPSRQTSYEDNEGRFEPENDRRFDSTTSSCHLGFVLGAVQTGEHSDALGLQASSSSCESIVCEESEATGSVAPKCCVGQVNKGSHGDMGTSDVMCDGQSGEDFNTETDVLESSSVRRSIDCVKSDIPEDADVNMEPSLSLASDDVHLVMNRSDSEVGENDVEPDTVEVPLSGHSIEDHNGPHPSRQTSCDDDGDKFEAENDSHLMALPAGPCVSEQLTALDGASEDHQMSPSGIEHNSKINSSTQTCDETDDGSEPADVCALMAPLSTTESGVCEHIMTLDDTVENCLSLSADTEDSSGLNLSNEAQSDEHGDRLGGLGGSEPADVCGLMALLPTESGVHDHVMTLDDAAENCRSLSADTEDSSRLSVFNETESDERGHRFGGLVNEYSSTDMLTGQSNTSNDGVSNPRLLLSEAGNYSGVSQFHHESFCSEDGDGSSGLMELCTAQYDHSQSLVPCDRDLEHARFLLSSDEDSADLNLDSTASSVLLGFILGAVQTGEDSDALGLQASSSSCQSVVCEESETTESVAPKCCVGQVNKGSHSDLDTSVVMCDSQSGEDFSMGTDVLKSHSFCRSIDSERSVVPEDADANMKSRSSLACNNVNQSDSDNSDIEPDTADESEASSSFMADANKHHGNSSEQHSVVDDTTVDVKPTFDNNHNLSTTNDVKHCWVN